MVSFRLVFTINNGCLRLMKIGESELHSFQDRAYQSKMSLRTGRKECILNHLPTFIFVLWFDTKELFYFIGADTR